MGENNRVLGLLELVDLMDQRCHHRPLHRRYDILDPFLQIRRLARDFGSVFKHMACVAGPWPSVSSRRAGPCLVARDLPAPNIEFAASYTIPSHSILTKGSSPCGALSDGPYSATADVGRVGAG